MVLLILFKYGASIFCITVHFHVHIVVWYLVAVCDKSKQVPCLWVFDPVSRAARWQDHCVLRQRLCTQELCAEAAEVITLFPLFVVDFIIFATDATAAAVTTFMPQPNVMWPEA